MGTASHEYVDALIAKGTVQNPAYATLKIELPAGVLIKRILGFAKDPLDGAHSDFLPCAQGGECQIGWAMFVADPVVNDMEEPPRRVVTWQFKNWSHNWERTARLWVDYETLP
jgi:hypothetical protein